MASITPQEWGIKTHPLYERIADRLADELGDTAISMAEDQDSHLVAFIATAEALEWVRKEGLS